jgi:hypothetical protein
MRARPSALPYGLALPVRVEVTKDEVEGSSQPSMDEPMYNEQALELFLS